MSFYKNVFLDAAGLEKAARAHVENDFILKDLSGRKGNNPMPLLYLDKDARYIVRLNEDGVIVAAATLYDGLVSKDVTTVGQISARVKRQGHAVALGHSIFNQAAADRKTLYLTPFEAEGAAASAAAAELHTLYPSVPVLYSGQAAPITAFRRYRLDVTPFGVIPSP